MYQVILAILGLVKIHLEIGNQYQLAHLVNIKLRLLILEGYMYQVILEHFGLLNYQMWKEFGNQYQLAHLVNIKVRLLVLD
jgi:hypothetical protein